jgi:hypothetical protein
LLSSVRVGYHTVTAADAAGARNRRQSTLILETTQRIAHQRPTDRHHLMPALLSRLSRRAFHNDGRGRYAT